MIRGLHHAAISSPDIDRLLGFYRDLLGLEVAFDGGWRDDPELDEIFESKESSGRILLVHVGNAYLEFYEWESPRPVDPGRRLCDQGITHISFEVEDLVALYERLVAAGVRFHCPPKEVAPGIRATYARDPDDNVVEFQEHAREDPIALPSR